MPLFELFHTIGIVAPAGGLRQEKFDDGISFLRSAGKQLKVGNHVHGPSPAAYLSASARDRADDLQELWTDPEVELLLALRGGFGSAHLPELLDWKLLAERPELPVIGYSDITALHWAMEHFRAGRPVAAPMLGKLREAAACPYTAKSFEQVFVKARYEILPPPEYGPFRILKPGSATGLPLVGNLSVAATLPGTGCLPDATGRILVLEDLNEPIYKLDRYLTVLEQSGLFGRCAGVLFGQFSDCAPEAELEQLFRRIALRVPGPVVMNFPFGHTLPMVSLDFHRQLSIAGDRVFVTV